MKRLLACILFCCIVLSLNGCYHEEIEYTDINDYTKIAELSEIRESESLELYPSKIANKNVQFFYFKWVLGFVGSAKIQFQCSIKYNKKEFVKELERISNIKANGKTIVKDTKSFCLPAYVSVLGYNSTNTYALIDEDNRTVHYIYLSIVDKEELKINKDYLPYGFYDLGDVKEQSYSIYK